ncbi:MAG: VWA domain-containing protein [Clostridia bacterium]|nr:VWA domain-containing protein [Clostridia bacterium]
MRNISFDNPYLLLLAIPLAVLVIVPHVFAIRKTNRTVATTVSLILHLLIIGIASLALAGMKQTTIITKTEVYVVADISYSSDKHLDRVDGYINDIDGKLPENSEYGVICFGKDYVLDTPMGESFGTVKDSGADNSATDIVSALEYAATLFSEDAIKRIVIITDGKQTATDGRLTNDDGTMNLVQTVKELRSRGIYVDAVYLDSNMTEDQTEVQLEGIDYISSTYLGHEATADILIRASRPMSAVVTVKKDGEELRRLPIDLDGGFNVVNISLPTDEVGQFRYDVHVEAEGDYSQYNNDFSFIQEISSELNLLIVASSADDVRAAMTLFGSSAKLDVYLVDGVLYNKYNNAKKNFGDTPNYENTTFHLNDPNVPSSIEMLCSYDEFIFINLDVRTLNNFVAFIDSVDMLVSEYGKSLLTIGDTYIQNKTDAILDNLQDMLPVQFGKNERDPKAYTLVIDASLSMVGAYRQQIAIQSAMRLTKLMNAGDRLDLIIFSGDINEGVHRNFDPGDPEDMKEVEEIITGIESSQGTVIGVALDQAYKIMEPLSGYSEKHVYLISDGLEGGITSFNYADAVRNMRKAGIYVSAIGTNCGIEGEATMKQIAMLSGNSDGYYNIPTLEALDDVILTDIADDITQSVIDGQQVGVKLNLKGDSVLYGIQSLPDIYGFVNASAKASATEVLSVDYVSGTIEIEEGVYEPRVATSALYSYWNYGDGRVACYAGAINGAWIKDWADDAEALSFLNNILTTNIPKERIDDPFDVSVDYDGISSTVTIRPAVVKPGAVVTATVTMPDGSVIGEELIFRTNSYFYTFETPLLGQYNIHISYTHDGKTYESNTPFCLPYSSEYDSFAYFYSTALVKAVTPDGVVSTDGIPELVNDKSRIETHIIKYTVSLMVLAVILFVIDLIFRILKWKDIVGLFRPSSSKRRKVK